MKALHLSPSFYPAHVYGGPIESLYQLCRHLAHNGCKVRVLTTDANGAHRSLEVEKEREVELVDGLYVRYCRRLARHSVSPMLVRLLPSYLRWADVVHLTAVYSFPTIPTLLAARLYGKPVVWSPRGALQRWRGSSRLRAKAVWEWACRLTAPGRVILHTTSNEEAKESVERVRGIEAFVLPNGVEIPEKIRRVDRDGTLRLAYLGRLHSKKGIENLLAACHRLSLETHLDWSLTIAGGGETDYVASLNRLIGELELSPRAMMIGEVTGESKTRLFERADVVVVPSYTENFGMVVGEALAHGVPVIASRGTPWRRLEETRSGLWVDNTPDSLAAAIESIGRMSLCEMGVRGRSWMQREFSWEQRATEMTDIYSRLINGPT